MRCSCNKAISFLFALSTIQPLVAFSRSKLLRRPHHLRMSGGLKRSCNQSVPGSKSEKQPRKEAAGVKMMNLRDTPPSKEATSSRDGVKLANSSVILPWIGYGTYKLGKTTSRELTLQALREGYRFIDTAFIYGGETTESQVGMAIQDALKEGTISDRTEVVVQSKHWRKYHGYEPTLECLRLSLKRLQLDYIDVWLIHWPGPAWCTMSRRNDVIEEHGAWHYATQSKEELPEFRAEIWRAMETALKEGKVKAIGVSNFSIAHLERLKETATIWPPAVNQIECHPLYPQTELLQYCAEEGIQVQAYASLGGQDAGKSFWRKLYPHKKGVAPVKNMLTAPPVIALSAQVRRTPAQVLLRWALERNIVVLPKASSSERMVENRSILDFSLTKKQTHLLEAELARAVRKAAEVEGDSVSNMARLCWRSDPLRLLDFD